MRMRNVATWAFVFAFGTLNVTSATARCMVKLNGKIIFGDGICADYHFHRCIDIPIVKGVPADVFPVERCNAGSCVAKSDVPCDQIGQLIDSKGGSSCKVELLSKSRMESIVTNNLKSN